MGSKYLPKTAESNPEVGLDSYDRFFPNQDTLPRGGFGNLIALPLQKAARHAGNSVFINEQLQVIDDQWVYLAGIKKITRFEIEQLVSEAEAKGRVVGIRLEIIEEENSDILGLFLPRLFAQHLQCIIIQLIFPSQVFSKYSL